MIFEYCVQVVRVDENPMGNEQEGGENDNELSDMDKLPSEVKLYYIIRILFMHNNCTPRFLVVCKFSYDDYQHDLLFIVLCIKLHILCKLLNFDCCYLSV